MRTCCKTCRMWFCFVENKTCAELAACSTTVHKHVRACPTAAVKWPCRTLCRWRFAEETHCKPVRAWKMHMLLGCMYKQDEIFLSGM
jgi:hypothetical protein